MEVKFTNGKENKRIAKKILKNVKEIQGVSVIDSVIYDSKDRVGKVSYTTSHMDIVERVLFKERVIDNCSGGELYKRVLDYGSFGKGVVFKTENDERIVKTSPGLNHYSHQSYGLAINNGFSSRTTNIEAAIDELIDERDKTLAMDSLVPVSLGVSLATLGYAAVYFDQNVVSLAVAEFNPIQLYASGLFVLGDMLALIGLCGGTIAHEIFGDKYKEKLVEIKSNFKKLGGSD